MTVTIFWLSLGILTLIFLIMLLIFYTLYRREIKWNRIYRKSYGRSSCFLIPKINCLFLCLWWSIKSGAKDTKRPLPTLILERLSSKSRQTNVFDRPMFLESAKIWICGWYSQSGLPWQSFYNPSKPQIGFVERYAGLVGFYKIGMILTVGIYLWLVCILALLGWIVQTHLK